jgi:hypothetical protein
MADMVQAKGSREGATTLADLDLDVWGSLLSLGNRILQAAVQVRGMSLVAVEAEHH